MFKICLLFSLFVLISAHNLKLLEKLRRRRNNRNHNDPRMVSFCHTHFEFREVTSAIHYKTGQQVFLPQQKDRSNLYYVGSCTSKYPITHSRGVCAITMQRHRGTIRVSRDDAIRFRYKNCKPVARHPELRDCSEWIEVPGLCQHKLNR